MCLVFVSAALFSGCGQAPSLVDLDAARAQVDNGLRAWKQGQEFGSLESGPTPMRFFDTDWQTGWKLLTYEIKEVTAGDNATGRVQVSLSVQNEEGKRIDKDVIYVFDKTNLAVARDPYF
jgi:hypothetical protein